MDDQTYWDQLEEPFVLQADFEINPASWPLGIDLGLSLGYDSTTVSDVDVSSTSLELLGGVRKTFLLADGHLRPHVGAGLSLLMVDVTAEYLGDSVSDDDATLGLYLRLGLSYVFNGGFGLGADYRVLRGTDVSLYGLNGDADFDQLLLTFSWGF